MEITVLGSGTYQPELKRHCSGYLIKISRQNLVFDFGRGTLDQLLKLGINYFDIDSIFISHTHADHCSELSSFLHITLARPPTAKFKERDLTIYGPKGLKKNLNHILRAFNLTKYWPLRNIKVKELVNNSVVKGKSWMVQSYIVKHSPTLNCLAFRLKSKNKILAYSGDTEDCLGLRKACKNADLAIIEASNPKGFGSGHMTGEIVGQLAQDSKLKKLILTHISPRYLKNFNVKKEVKKFYEGPVFIAKDLMKIKI